MYINVITLVRACDNEFEIFSIKIGLHQEPTPIYLGLKALLLLL
jgi:hypothetical protein